ncbi:MAG: GNAT family N-acetyltransferase [Dongiaceae bacterium]
MSDIAVDEVTALSVRDLDELCEAADDAIRAGGGFGWLTPPERSVMENYWRGVLLVPDRRLFIGRLDSVIVGSAQLQRSSKNNEAQAHAARLTSHFVAPWARGHGVARALLVAVENAARLQGHATLELDVRETQEAALQIYRHYGYTEWGRHPDYARVDGRPVGGLHFYKLLATNAGEGSSDPADSVALDAAARNGPARNGAAGVTNKADAPS